MAFPLTHLCVAWKILESQKMPPKEAAQFLLGSIAPDAVHYRKEFTGAAMQNIGPAKKITHLCPISEERWGQVTDNDGWIARARDYAAAHSDPFAKGYAAHALTDIHNNRTIWNNFRNNHPSEAAKGYTSDYYTDLRNIDTRLYLEFPDRAELFALFAKAAPQGNEYISAEEIRLFQQNLLHEQYKNMPATVTQTYKFATYDETIKFIDNAANFCIKTIFHV